MNYKKIYSDFINSRRLLNRQKSKEVYYENHHIIPKSLGGSDDLNNMVLLTAKEHYIAHLILTRCYEGKEKVKAVYALWRMGQTGYKTNGRSLNSNQYETIRKLTSELCKGENHGFFGKTHSNEYKKWLSENMSGDKNPAKQPGIGDKISKAKKGVPNLNLRGYKHSEEFCKRVSLRKKGKSNLAWEGNKNPMKNPEIAKRIADNNCKPIIQLTLTNEFVKEWRSAQDAKKTLGGAIDSCLKGNCKSAVGFKWVYKKLTLNNE